jgi:hypothetical protein
VYRKLGGLPPRNRIYEGHTDIATKALHRFEKALMPLKMYLKSPAIREKARIPLKKSSEVFDIFINALHF